MRTIIEALDHRVLLTDGSLARQLQGVALNVKRDFYGAEGCNEVLNLTRAPLIRRIHRSYLEAGADVIRTNSLAAGPLSLAPLGLAEETFYINYSAAQIACEAVDSVPGRGRRRFVLGIVRDHGWDAAPAEVAQAVELQVQGLLAGGADGVVLDIVPGVGRAPMFLNGARRARETLKARASIFLQRGHGEVEFSERSLVQADALIRFRHGSAEKTDWLHPAILRDQVNLIGGGASPADTRKLDQMLRAEAEDGLRPRTAWQREGPIDEVDPASSQIHGEALLVEVQ